MIMVGTNQQPAVPEASSKKNDMNHARNNIMLLLVNIPIHPILIQYILIHDIP
jgi:hypothetical protein